MIYQFITENKIKNLSLKKACQVLSVSPSGYFKNLKAQKQTQNNRKEEKIRIQENLSLFEQKQ